MEQNSSPGEEDQNKEQSAQIETSEIVSECDSKQKNTESDGHQMSDQSMQVNGTHVQVNGTPVQVNGTPVQVNGTHVQVNGTPGIEDNDNNGTGNNGENNGGPKEEIVRYPLLSAAEEFNVEKVEELLASGHDPNEKNQSGHNAIHVIILIYTDLDIVEQIHKKPLALDILSSLIRKGFDINSSCHLKKTALHLIAGYNQYPEIIKALLAAGAKINLLDKYGHTPLHIAITKRNYITAKTLVEGGADVDTGDMNRKTPIHILAQGLRTLPMLQLLLSCGASVHAKDVGGRTALHIASKWGREELIEELLRSEASVNMADNSGLTPLHYAVNGDITGKSALLLLNHKAHLNMQDHISRETALHKAIRQGSVDNIKEIMKFRPNLSVQDIVGDTPLHAAAAWRNVCVWQLLVRHGVDLTLVNRDGLTSLQKAEKMSNKMPQEFVKMYEHMQVQQ